MSKNKHVNLSKLKLSSNNKIGENSVKQQATLSKFFSSNFSRNAQRSNQDVNDDVLIVKSSKRSREENDVQEPTSSKRPCDRVTIDLTEERTPSQSFSQVRKLSDKTNAKLLQYQAQSDTLHCREKSGTIPLSNLLNDKRNRDVHVSLNSLPKERRDEDSDKETDEDMGPSTSCNKSPKISQFTNLQKRSDVLSKNTKAKYTPLEQQFMDIKEKYPDAVLFVECGYKYRFFGEDAEIAAKVLKIFCHLDHNFQTASIPVHRLFVHIRRLVAAGYKVGVVKQIETAALKAAGDNRNAPFTRQLTAMYTKSTLIGEDVESATEDGSGAVTNNVNSTLLCVYDSPMETKDKHQNIGILAIDPSTGKVTYDCFSDSDLRSELETRILHIQPVEIIMPHSLTEKTQQFINDTVKLSTTEDDRIRIEKLNDDAFEYSTAIESLSDFYKASNTGTFQLQEMINLPRPVISCLSALILYLRQFGVEKVLTFASEFTQFTLESKYLKLPGKAARNLELFQNQTTLQEKGSLFWVLNQTVTRYGSRLLRSWLSNPLLDIKHISCRHDAIQDLCNDDKSGSLGKLRGILGKTPDLEKGISSIFYNKSSVQEFYFVVKSLSDIHTEFSSLLSSINHMVKSELLKTIVHDVADLLQNVHWFADMLKEENVRANDKTNIFRDESDFPKIVKCKANIQSITTSLQNYRREVRLILKQPSLEYATVLGTEYLVEVKNTNLKLIPSDWTKISSTKVVSRFHSPFIQEKYKLLNQMREQLVLDCKDAWKQFSKSFSDNYVQYKKAIGHLATLDCLFSLATVAKNHGYCRPVLTDRTCIEIEQGRHPVISRLLGEQEQYVPNNTHINATNGKVMIITGPNMGGKSSYIKQVALFVIMSQMGSFLPAESATLGIFDAVYTRMGAADEIYRGRSTFMTELQEASEILSGATSRSVVILDELGRGTSTHDGMAIAYATLEYLIRKIKCTSLFVTHYPMLAEFENHYPNEVANYHMSFFIEEDQEEGAEKDSPFLTFLYELVPGMAGKSYGLNVARLASVPSSVIAMATEMSEKLENKMIQKRKNLEFFCDLMMGRTSYKMLQKEVKTNS